MESLERRKSRRFKLSWGVIIKGADKEGLEFEEEAELDNLSSGGAFLYVSRSVKVGTNLDLSIKLPMRRENWMCYPAEIIRVEGSKERFGVAMKFKATRPGFLAK